MLLAIDTSTRRIGIALHDGAQVLAEMTWTSLFHHTMELAPAVETSLRYAGIRAADLSAIGAAIGPGSFTALRTGLAFVKGLALAHGIPVFGVNSLTVTAASQAEMGVPMIAVLEAGRKRLAAQAFSWQGSWAPAGNARLVTIEELTGTITTRTWLCGELDGRAREILSGNPNALPASPSMSLRRPSVLAELALELQRNGRPDDPADISPVYLSTEGAEG